AMGSATAVFVLLFLVPMPHNIVTEGVVWLPRDAFLRAGVSGRVDRVGLDHGQSVEPGDFVLQLEAPERQAALDVAETRWRGARAAYEAARFTDRAVAVTLLSDLEDARNVLADAR